jgi:ceramide glucosyltransferase
LSLRAYAIAVEVVTTLLTLGGLGYYLVALWSARAFVRSVPIDPSGQRSGVSILKSLKGLDPGMYAGFASHCRQDYDGEYELIFGVSSMDDPAVAAVRQLQADFPTHAIYLIQCVNTLGANRKISNLAQMLPYARYPHILINDSDIFVSPRYLRRVMGHFAAPSAEGTRVGMVTAPYRGIAHGTLGSRLEALGISTDFIAGALTARFLDGGLRFGLGSTLAVTREALEAIGGLAPLVDYLADDYELGLRIHRAGLEVALAREVVETSVPAYRFSQFLAHQLRWARSIRDSRKLGYLGLIFTCGLPLAIITVVASGFALWSVALLSITLAARVALALAVGVGILNDGRVLRDLWLLPLRDMIALGVWAWSYAGHTITWRGEEFTLRNGKLKK